MPIYQCDDCGFFFTESNAASKDVDCEEEYGVGSLFKDHHRESVLACPSCQSTDVEEADEDDMCEILNKKGDGK